MFSYGRLSSHHRSGVRDQDHRGLGAEDQAADLGHSRTGEVRSEGREERHDESSLQVQSRHQELLQRSRWSSARALLHRHQT